MSSAFQQQARALLLPVATMRQQVLAAAACLRSHGVEHLAVAHNLEAMARGEGPWRMQLRQGGRYDHPREEARREARDRLVLALYALVPAGERNPAKVMAEWVRHGDPRVPKPAGDLPVKLATSELRMRDHLREAQARAGNGK